MKRITHNLQQGSAEWHQFRAAHFGSSEAAAMLGISKTTTRAELLRQKHSGVSKDFSDFVQNRILDKGHAVEALARPLLEDMIGEELYPVVMSYGKMSASCDGLTADGTTAFEHKQWNEALAESLRGGVLPAEHWPQVQQILAVTGAERCYFVCSDGTKDRFAYVIVRPRLDVLDKLASGWAQFEKNLDAYTMPDVMPAAVAAPVMALPTVSIQVTGAVALTSNLGEFHSQLQAFVKRIPVKPATDQEFADCKAAVKALKDAEDALDAAEKQALGQVASFDDMRRAKNLCFDLSRQTRLALEKLVVARERQIKEEIVSAARVSLAAHVESLDTMLGNYYMPSIADKFGEVIKSKRTVASLQNAVDAELVRLRIEADGISRVIQANLNTLESDAADHKSLFPDLTGLLTKNADDFKALVWLRISEQKAAEARKAELAAKAQAEADARKADVKPVEVVASAPAVQATAVQAPAVSEAIPTPPSREAIIAAVGTRFDVTYVVASRWLCDIFAGG